MSGTHKHTHLSCWLLALSLSTACITDEPEVGTVKVCTPVTASQIECRVDTDCGPEGVACLFFISQGGPRCVDTCQSRTDCPELADDCIEVRRDAFETPNFLSLDRLPPPPQ